MKSEEKSIFCRLCGRRIDQDKGHYVVRIEVYAAGEPPEKRIYHEDGGDDDFQSKVDKLLQEIAETNPLELENGVYKFFKFDLCRLCQREYIKNPLNPRT